MSIDLKGLRILMADDDIYNMRPTIDALEARGAVVLVARSGTEAIDALSDRVFDLVILDIMMSSGPKIKTDDQGRSAGLKVHSQIRKGRNANVPIVVSTVVSDPEAINSFGDDPLCIVLNKPYTFSQLKDAIEQLLSPKS